MSSVCDFVHRLKLDMFLSHQDSCNTTKGCFFFFLITESKFWWSTWSCYLIHKQKVTYTFTLHMCLLTIFDNCVSTSSVFFAILYFHFKMLP